MKKGFTIIELMVAIVVILLLATILVLSLTAAKNSSLDDKRRASVQQVELALKTLRLRTDDTLMAGGYQVGAPAPINGMCQHNSSSNNASASDANWLYRSNPTSAYSCTLGSMLLATNLLPSNFFDKLPENDQYGGSVDRRRDAAMTLYRCDTTNKKWILYYYLKSPTTAESTSIATLRGGCSQGPALSVLRDTLKMAAAVEINL